MAIITKTGTPSKGSPTTFTLDKTELASLVSALESPSDVYYSSSSNWKTVFVVYKSSVGNQSEILKFDAAQSTPSADFSVSSTARDSFEVSKITIHDFDGGVFDIPRTELITSDFDVIFSSTPTPTFIQYDLYSAINIPMVDITGGVLGGSSNYSDLVKSSSFFPVGMNFILEFQIDWTASPTLGGVFVGVSQFSDYQDFTFPDPFQDRAFGLLQTENNAGIVRADLYNDGYPVITAILVQTPGLQTYRIEYNGGSISHYINGALIYQETTALYDAYPTVRTMGYAACSSSYKY